MVTGGAGFIGSAVIRHIINETDYRVLNVDKLTYASSIRSLDSVSKSCRYSFTRTDILDVNSMMALFASFRPDIVMNLAAESHVDRSIDNAEDFIFTNVVGTYRLLEVARDYWSGLPREKKDRFLFHHVSTDEVFGDLINSKDLFSETSNYRPSSPYAASKASSDHLVRAWHRTYSLPSIVTNCSNNYGPYQHPEKLIPLIILRALMGSSLPVYGSGKQVRDWLFVEDHASALIRVAQTAKPGATYNIGGETEVTNLKVVQRICDLLETLAPDKPNGVQRYSDLIEFVVDRPGHDFRYAIDNRNIVNDLGWRPKESFDSGLTKTILWYIANDSWLKSINSGAVVAHRRGVYK